MVGDKDRFVDASIICSVQGIETRSGTGKIKQHIIRTKEWHSLQSRIILVN
jgi:hypothetical protein